MTRKEPRFKARQRGARFLPDYSHPVARLFMPQADTALVALFEQLNDTYFAGVLPLVPVVVVPTPEPTEEDTSPGVGMIWPTIWTLVGQADGEGEGIVNGIEMEIRLYQCLFEDPDPSIWDEDEPEDWRSVPDTLLHEMVHLAVYLDVLGQVETVTCDYVDQELGGHHQSYHDQRFADECNRIGRIEGWPEVLPSDPAGRMFLQDSAVWPQYKSEEDWKGHWD
jgi:hypothetical protein